MAYITSTCRKDQMFNMNFNFSVQSFHTEVYPKCIVSKEPSLLTCKGAPGHAEVMKENR